MLSNYLGVICFGALGQFLMSCMGGVRSIDENSTCNTKSSKPLLVGENETLINQIGDLCNSSYDVNRCISLGVDSRISKVIIERFHWLISYIVYSNS